MAERQHGAQSRPDVVGQPRRRPGVAEIRQPVAEPQADERHQHRDQAVAAETDATCARVGIGGSTGDRHGGRQRHPASHQVLAVDPAGRVAAAVARRQDEVVAAAQAAPALVAVNQQKVGVEDGKGAVALVDLIHPHAVGLGRGGLALALQRLREGRHEGLHQAVAIHPVRRDVVDVDPDAREQEQDRERHAPDPVALVEEDHRQAVAEQQDAVDDQPGGEQRDHVGRDAGQLAHGVGHAPHGAKVGREPGDQAAERRQQAHGELLPAALQQVVVDQVDRGDQSRSQADRDQDARPTLGGAARLVAEPARQRGMPGGERIEQRRHHEHEHDADRQPEHQLVAGRHEEQAEQHADQRYPEHEVEDHAAQHHGDQRHHVDACSGCQIVALLLEIAQQARPVGLAGAVAPRAGIVAAIGKSLVGREVVGMRRAGRRCGLTGRTATTAASCRCSRRPRPSRGSRRASADRAPQAPAARRARTWRCGCRRRKARGRTGSRRWPRPARSAAGGAGSRHARFR